MANGPVWMEREMTQLALLLTLCVPVGWTQNPAQQERIHQLQDSMLAPCCWAESVAVHRSEPAMQMRLEIKKFVLEGKTDREILDYYTRVP